MRTLKAIRRKALEAETASEEGPIAPTITLTSKPHRLYTPIGITALRHHIHTGIPPRRRRSIQRHEILPPALGIRPQYPAIIRQKPIDLALDIRRLRVDGPAARVLLRLLQQLPEDLVRALAPDGHRGVELVGLVDGEDGFLHVPEVLDGDVVADAAKFALETDLVGVGRVRGGRDGVVGCAALRGGVVVVVEVVAGAVEVPAGRAVDEARRVELSHDVSEAELRIGGVGQLAPAFVVDDPGHDAGVVAVLFDEEFELSLEFHLLCWIG